MQIDLESRAAAACSKATSETAASSSSPLSDVPTSENSPLVAPTASISPAPVASLETSEEPASENSPLVAPAASISSMPLAPLETTEEPAEHLELEAAAAPVPLRAPKEAEEHWDEDAPDALVAMLRRDIQTEEEELEHSRRWIWLVAAIVALFLVAGGVYLLRFRNQTAASRSAATVSAPTTSAQPVATPAASSPAAGERTVTKIDAATIGLPPAPPDSSALPAPKAATADPATWLEGWAAAMRSRDPVAQASFYADPVSQYIDRKNVSRSALVQAKKADIGRRHGDWTFSANDVVVESRTPSEATVQLVKHYMVKTGPSQVSEIFVKTRLHLKSVDGQWKIASEEELHSPAVASVNPIDQ
jgi:hypothetical protein